MVNNCINNILSWLFPSQCLFCGSSGLPGMDLCHCCEEALPLIRHPCQHCGLPLPEGYGGQACGECLNNPPLIQQTISPFAFSSPIRESIFALKYRGRQSHGRLLSHLLTRHLQQNHNHPWPELIIPVPLHPGRQRQRGFNQALELVRPLSRQFGISLRTDLCHRIRPTTPQSELDAKQRIINVKGAFSLELPENIKHVAIVDDVITTGHTVNEIARLLAGKKVDHIEAWSIARAVI